MVSDKKVNQETNKQSERPVGAIVITIILALIILAGWFGVFALYVSRS